VIITKQPSQNDILPTWNVISNLNPPVEIKYPDDYEYRQLKNSKEMIEVSFNPREKIDVLNAFILTAASQRKVRSLEEIKQDLEKDADVRNIKLIEVNGRKSYTYDLSDNIQSTLVIFDNTLIELRHMKGYKEDIYNQMLSSIKSF